MNRARLGQLKIITVVGGVLNAETQIRIVKIFQCSDTFSCRLQQRHNVGCVRCVHEYEGDNEKNL